MADTTVDGTSYLDLAGNRVVWYNTKHERILLDGSNFGDILPMATLAVSALCLLCFLSITFSVCCVCCRRRHVAKYLSWGAVWVPIFCMIGFFAIDITNRVFHELEETFPSAYIAIDVGIGTFSSTADGLVQVYLIKHSPVDIKSAGSVPRRTMKFALALYALLSIVTRGAQIWDVFQQIDSDHISSGKKLEGYYALSTKVWQDCASAASGMLLLFAIGYGLFAITYIRRLPITNKNRSHLRWTVAILAAAFLGRNVVNFFFVLYFAQYQHIASLGAQLAYLALYGLLSVAIYTSIVAIAGFQEKEEPTSRPDGLQDYPYYQYSYVPKE